MSQDIVFDKKDQLERIQAMMIEGEKLYAVYDLKGAGTGFVGVSDRRLVFMDQGFIRKKKSLVSLPYSKITAVASEDSGGIIFGSSNLIVLAGSKEFEFEFRSNEKAHHAYQLIMRKEKAGLMSAR